MLNVSSRISTIKALLDEKTDAALAYAALECRLTIEQVCYERLRMSYGHIAYDDLRKWPPRHVVQQVVEDANTHAASGFTLFVSKEPVESHKDLTKEEFEALEYVPIGRQTGFSPNRFGRLWNALSRLGLHVKLPKRADDPIPAYSSGDTLRNKITETLEELEKVKDGTLLASGFGRNYFFPCVTCGTEIRRIDNLLKRGQIVNCPNPDCPETYLIDKEAEVTRHCRRIAELICQKCESKYEIPLGFIEKLNLRESREVKCDNCGESHEVCLRPVALRPAKVG